MANGRIIGLTGGIGAGKSVVSRILRGQGFTVYDCDMEARWIMDTADELKAEICTRLGADCLNADGSLCRPKIAEVVFNDADQLNWLNSRVHCMVRDDVHLRASQCSCKTMFVESAILKSSKLTELCNEIWVVTAPDDIRLERACNRDKQSENKIKARMNAQASEYEDFGNIPTKIIDNSGTRALLPRLLQLLKTI
ncbi:MAG: dephospho-CoA kinase [Muribaculaceae bacterium]|nr:dephospho-CoA kinase [Muribaculaceae bacterium]